MDIGVDLKLPMVAHVYDSEGSVVLDCHKVVYVNTAPLVIYHSYQHPIAFFTLERMVMRKEFWFRRRQARSKHVNAILRDYAQLGLQFKSLFTPTAVALENAAFKQTLHEELIARGFGLITKEKNTEKQTTTKRRVIL